MLTFLGLDYKDTLLVILYLVIQGILILIQQNIIGMDLVTSSQTLREKDIQPSKLNFGFLGLGKSKGRGKLLSAFPQIVYRSLKIREEGFFSYLARLKVNL